MSWVAAWLGIPYMADARGPDAYDCLGFFLAVHEARTGQRLPDPLARGACHAEAHTATAPDYARVTPDAAQEGDALLFRGLGTGALHMGYALDATDMLHAGGDGFAAHPPSRVENWRSAAWMRRLEGVYRAV